MKAVMSTVPEHILEWRRRTGADRWDEMWERVLHMAPSPNREHQDLEGELESWLRRYWAKPNGCRVYHQINVAESGTWPDNYRVPDLVLLTPARFHIDRNEYFEGGPDAVVEIRSPGDETYEKFDFYAKINVSEIWVIDRDSRRPVVYRLQDGEFVPSEPNQNGWISSAVANIELRLTADDSLEIRVAGNDETKATLP
jgi:Uma2 family endonuclease